jgi:hypothetical protein
MTRPRLNLSDAVEDLSPPPPPCFYNRGEWVLYLKSAAAAQTQRDEAKVIVHDEFGTPSFNRAYPFCQDCAPAHKQRMMEQGKCHPTYLTGPPPNGGLSSSDPQTQGEQLCLNFKEPSAPSDPSSSRSAQPPQEKSKHIQRSCKPVDLPKPKPGDLSSVFARWVR